MGDEHKHVWVDGPDGKECNCANCSITKLSDHACYDTCESWREYERRRTQPAAIAEDAPPALTMLWSNERISAKVHEAHALYGGVLYAHQLTAAMIAMRNEYEAALAAKAQELEELEAHLAVSYKRQSEMEIAWADAVAELVEVRQRITELEETTP